MLLARNKDGKYVQLTESTTIISVLSSYLIDPATSIQDLVKYYPSISYMNDAGKKAHDVLNRYFVIYGEKLPKGLNKQDFEYV